MSGIRHHFVAGVVGNRAAMPPTLPDLGQRRGSSRAAPSRLFRRFVESQTAVRARLPRGVPKSRRGFQRVCRSRRRSRCGARASSMSMIHAIVCSLVFMSGAGTILFGADDVNQFGGLTRVIALQFSERHLRRVAHDAAFAPPNGTLTTAHFQVIHAASALISSSVTSGA